MRQLFIGAISGFVVAAFIFASPVAFSNSEDTKAVSRFGAPMFHAGGFMQLRNESKEYELTLRPGLPDDFPFFKVAMHQPLLTLTRHDLKEVCLSELSIEDGSSSILVDIKFTDNARKRLGAALQDLDGAEVSLSLFEHQIGNSIIDGSKAEMMARQGVIYPQMPDLVYTIYEHGAFDAYTMLKSLTGNDELVACNEQDDVTSFMGYEEHAPLWEYIKTEFNTNQRAN